MTNGPNASPPVGGVATLPPEAGEAVIRRVTVRHPDGRVETTTTVPLSGLWTVPMTAGALARAFGVDRKSIAARIADGSVHTKAFGGLVRVRLDDAPPTLAVRAVRES